MKLGEVLRRGAEVVELQPATEYREITIRLWGKGVVLRGLVSGAEITASRRSVARQGQFILSRIDARNGAMGIVPAELDGAIISNDFPVFDIAADRLLPGYMGWMCKTAAFIEICQKASEGTTNRVRLQEDKFLATEIALPLLSEQRRIVALLQGLFVNIEEVRALRNQVVEETEALVVSTHLRLAGSRTKKLRDVLALDEREIVVSPTGEYPQVGVRGFGGGLFAKGPILGTETTYRSFNRLYEGALVLSQVKGWEGAIGICGADLAGWFVSPEYRTFRCIRNEVRPDYLAALVSTEWFWGQLKDATRGVGARRERTRPEQFLEIEMPMPDILRQVTGERIFASMKTLKALQSDIAPELSALMPSILDKGFRREL